MGENRAVTPDEGRESAWSCGIENSRTKDRPRYSCGLVDHVLDRGDHGVGGLAEDLRVLVRSRCEYRHALVGLLGGGHGSAHRAHLLLGGARVGSGAYHEHGRAFERGEGGSELAVDG